MRPRRANPGGETVAEALHTGVAGADMGCTIAASAAGTATRAELHSVEGDGTGRTDCGARASVSGAGCGSDIDAHLAAFPDAWARQVVHGLASLPVGVVGAFTVSAGQRPSDQTVRVLELQIWARSAVSKLATSPR